MSGLIGVLLVVFLAVVLLAALKKGGVSSGSIGFPYQPAKALFSPAERSFLGVLDQAVGSEFRVFGKVRVADVASVQAGLGNAARQGALNRIASKNFDFVVCRASDLAIVCAIELNDKSHASARAQARDELLGKVCEAVRLPLVTVPAKQGYAVPDVRALFEAAIAPPAPAVTA